MLEPVEVGWWAGSVNPENSPGSPTVRPGAPDCKDPAGPLQDAFPIPQRTPGPSLRGHRPDPGQARPVLPKPPSALSVLSSSDASTTSGVSNRAKTSWAIRSPRAMRTGVPERFRRRTFSSPR